MLTIEELKSIYPLVVTPSHDGKFFHNYLTSLLNFQHQALHKGMPLQFLLMQGESLITRARNNCVATFLENPEWTHLFWIDSDIGFSAEAAFRLLQADYDIAAGVYPLKRDHWPADGLPEKMTYEQFLANYQRYTVNARAEEGKEHLDIYIQEDGFIEMSEAPTGFMVIKRAVFEKLMKHYPELKYVPDSLDVVDQGLHYRFFDVMVDSETGRYLSEDYGFCRLWEGIGEKIYIDAKSNLSHQGMKIYQGDFAASLKNNFSLAIPAKAGLQMKLHGLNYLSNEQ
ncbi:hypothetical protein BEN71_15185 [Acinetobacter wuhouensis]|uniref:hypothetical protein n=2 Tax=Acinetobacter TaxID=469 RepID=UPI00083B2B11|nr:hypothetical protein [Acinetobacter wuhouensis]AXQ23331.1 hypothetical protein BEN71_15185 [Acinetobacter wuhouensis]